MPLRISFWHYSLPLTNSPVSLLVNLFFFSSLFSLSGWDIFISSVGFLSLSRTRICLPASPSLCSCQLFWHLCVANKPNWKYLCINKWGRGAVWKRRETTSLVTPQDANTSVYLSVYLFIYPPPPPVLHHGPFVWQEMDELCRWKGIQATWRRPHWSLSPLCLSLTRPVRPSVPAPSKGRLSRHKGRSEHTHTHTDEDRKKRTLFWPDKWTLGDSERGTSGSLSSPCTMEAGDFVVKTETEDKTDEEQSFCFFMILFRLMTQSWAYSIWCVAVRLVTFLSTVRYYSDNVKTMFSCENHISPDSQLFMSCF